jgi:hypothetical protein
MIWAKYDLGEITYPNEFNPTYECSSGCIYFTTIDHVFKFMDYGCYFCEIQTSNDSRCYIEKDKIKANKIIITNMTHISELDWNDLKFCANIVKQNGCALKYVKEQTLEICIEAVKRDGYALRYVKKQTEEICLEAVKQYGDALQNVEKQTLEICLEAVRQDESALRYVDEQIEIEMNLLHETDVF